MNKYNFLSLIKSEIRLQLCEHRHWLTINSLVVAQYVSERLRIHSAAALCHIINKH